MPDEIKQTEPNYDGYRWIGVKFVWQDEKLYCHFCKEAIVYSSGPGTRGIAHILLDEEEFDPYTACGECLNRVIGNIYPPDDKLFDAAKKDGLPLCAECGKQTRSTFMHGYGIVEHMAVCDCGRMTKVDEAKWPYKECEALFKTSPIWKAFFARRGYGGTGATAAMLIYQERKLKELIE